jgi:hypothetical protein
MDNLWETVVKEFAIKGLIIGVVGGALLTYLNENLSVLRTSLLIASARRKLATRKPGKVMRAIHTLVEIAQTRPTRRQEMVDIIVEDCFRRIFGRAGAAHGPTSPRLAELFVSALRALLSLPRVDENGHGLNIDLHQIALISEMQPVYLEKMNFKDVVLWGSEFVKVDLSRSTFENADLGGVRFVECGLEDLEMKKARLSYSPLDRRPTMIHGSAVARSNIDEAWILETESPQLSIAHSEIDRARLELLMSKSHAVRIEAS